MAGETRLSDLARPALLCAGLLVLLGFGIKTIETMPPETPVVFDEASGRYATAACAEAGWLERPFSTNPFDIYDDRYRATLGQVRRYGKERAHPDAVCVDRGGFEGKVGSVSGDAFRDLLRLIRS